MKRYCLPGILAVIVFFAVASCDTGTNPETQTVPVNPLVGTWKAELFDPLTHRISTLTFTETEFTYVYIHELIESGDVGVSHYNGKYTFTNDTMFYEMLEPANHFTHTIYKIYGNSLYGYGDSIPSTSVLHIKQNL
jgi:hypothetical protein